MRFSILSTRFLCFALAFVCLTAFGASAASAAENRLNQQLAQGQTVQDYKVSPDGKYGVYIVSEYVNDSAAQQLFSVNLSTREVKALSPRVTGGKSILQYEITATNRVVVYTDAVTQYTFELYSVPVAGGTIVKLNRTYASGANIYSAGIQNFKISPDGARLVYYYYESPEEGDGKNILYSVPTAGGTSVRLTSQTAGAQLNNYIFTPDSRRVVYEFAPNYDSGYAVYSAPATGGAAALLTNKFYADYYQVTSDSQTLVYQADTNGDSILELYASPIAGGARTQLSLASEDVSGFRLSNAYSAVVYAYKPVGAAGYNATAFGIVSIDARSRYAIQTGKQINSDFEISPDNRGIVFTTYEQIPGGQPWEQQTNLYSATLDSRGQLRKLNDATTSGVGFFKITPDGSRVVFYGFPAAGGGGQIYSVPTIDGGVVRLSSVTNGSQFAAADSKFQITPDGKRVVFAYDAQNYVDGASNYDLFSNAIAGGSLRKAAANVENDFTLAGSARVVYTRSNYSYDADGNYIGSKQLYTAGLTQ